MHRNSSHRGFTIVELMVVVAMIGILAGIALSYAGEPRASVRGFAESVVGEADTTRLRAISSRRWQRMTFDLEERKVLVEQATYAGMVVPEDDEYALISKLDIPREIDVVSIAPTANVIAGDGIPADGDGLTLTLLFAPDGAAEPRTIYLRNPTGRNPFRVVVYRATGTAYSKEGW